MFWKAGWQVTVGLSFLLVLPGFAQDPSAAKKAEQRDQEQCQKDIPTFSVEWFGSRGAVLVVKADPPLNFKKITISPTSLRKCGESRQHACPQAVSPSPPSGEANCGPKQDGAIIYEQCDILATREGTRLNIPFNGEQGKQNVDNIYAQNGWVMISYIGDSTDPCPQRQTWSVTQPIVERHQLSIDAGSVFALQKDGSWKSQPEIALAARSRWWNWLTGFVDFRYSYIGAVSKSASDSGSTGQGKTGKADQTQDNQTPNPFESGGGSFRGNFYLAVHPFETPSFSTIGGVGFSTVPDEGTVKAPVRYFGGARFQVHAYNVKEGPEMFGNSSGFIQLGWAHDNLWEWDEVIPAATTGGTAKTIHHDERRRWFAEAQVSLPDTPGRAISFSPRIYADLPVSGKGPSDIRVSILAKLNLQNFTNMFPGH